MMSKTFTLLAAFIAALFLSVNPVSASEPDRPGSKLITVQGGYGPGIGGNVSGNIVMANLGASHLYGGLQFGGNLRHGAVTGSKKLELSVAPRLMLGFNLGRVVELHFGGLAGVAAQRFDSSQNKLVFSYAGFGGLRLNVSDSFAILMEGYYAYPTKYLHLPYGSAGFAFRF